MIQNIYITQCMIQNIYIKQNMILRNIRQYLKEVKGYIIKNVFN
jgi:hypothetical protein